MASIGMECIELLKIEKTRHEIRAWKDDPRLKINFNFSIQTRFRNYYWMAPHSVTRPVSIQGLVPNRDYEGFVSGGAVFAVPFSDGYVREAVEWAVEEAGLRLNQRRHVVERVVKEVRERCPEGGRAILDLDFKVVIEHLHVYFREADVYDYPRMIPAADSALGLLEKCEVGGATTAERCCCICLEEFGGEEAARMPCKHVFHGGCIKEWLRTSHYCPLCRYEMPTE